MRITKSTRIKEIKAGDNVTLYVEKKIISGRIIYRETKKYERVVREIRKNTYRNGENYYQVTFKTNKNHWYTANYDVNGKLYFSRCSAGRSCATTYNVTAN